jgi:hypothetical protein
VEASEQPREHRWGTRVVLDTPASLRRIYGLETAARLRDVSLSGAFVETTDRLPRFSRIAVRTLSSPSYWIEAWVVRDAADGIGIEWLEPGSHMVLEMMLTQRSAVADRRSLVSREDRPTPALDWCVATDGLSRARPEVESGEFDVKQLRREQGRGGK